MARYGDQQHLFRDNETLACRSLCNFKSSCRRCVNNLCELNNIEWVIAVPHNIIGPRQKYDDPFRNVVSIMINRMLQGKLPLFMETENKKDVFLILMIV